MAGRIDNPEAAKALKQFRLIYGCIRQHFREVERKCRISGSQLWILREVAGEPGIGVSQIAERLFIHQSTCSQLVEKLVSAGLAVKERSKRDQRRVGLSLTAVGAKLLAEAPGPLEGVFPTVLSMMDQAQLQELNRALANVVENLRTGNPGFSEEPLADL
ncbi:MAG TPA: MarR family winged helix-turn-helix transcriptional regulator [Parasulfuritortus sp.]